MRTLFKLAQRNIWRNKRRTFITAASILFAVAFAVFMNAIQSGTWDYMMDNVVNFHFGYAQVHNEGFWDDQTLDNAMDEKNPALLALKDIEGMAGVIPRVESFALASNEQNTRGTLVIGVDPDVEDRMTGLSERLVEGEFLKDGDKGAMVASGLAEYLSIGIGDTLVLISQGYRGTNAVGVFPVTGIFKFPNPELNKQMVYMDLPNAQYFFRMEGLITTLVLRPENKYDLPELLSRVKSSLDMEVFEVMDWEEMMPELVEARVMDAAGNYLFLGILYIIISFGIFGTLVMMLKEREYEFGVLVAIGMKRWRLGIMMWIETIVLGLIGVAAGIALAFPFVYWIYVDPIILTGAMAQAYEQFGFDPVITTTLRPNIFYNQAFLVFGVITVLAIYPMFKIARMKAVEAMRH